MDEKEIRKFFKEFAMYVNLPVPKVTINGETGAHFTVAEDGSIVQNEIMFEIGKETDRWDRIQYVSISWLLEVSKCPKFRDKIIYTIVNNFWGEETVDEQSTEENY